MSPFAPCPQCNASNAEKLKFTWWGGALGPKLLTHVKCQTCGKKYNDKSRREYLKNIIIYNKVI